MKFKHNKISDDTYAVKDDKGELCAIFELRDAPRTTPPSCRHLNLEILPHVLENLYKKGVSLVDIAYLVGIYDYVFHAVLRLTDQKGRPLCKIYARSEMNNLVYNELARQLDSAQYAVKTYGRWLEIRKIGKNLPDSDKFGKKVV